VWGGIDSYPGAKVESDWHLFDFGLGCWIKLNVSEIIENELGVTRVVSMSKHRKMHTMTPVLDINISNFVKYSRLPWVLP